MTCSIAFFSYLDSCKILLFLFQIQHFEHNFWWKPKIPMLLLFFTPHLIWISLFRKLIFRRLNWQIKIWWFIMSLQLSRNQNWFIFNPVKLFHLIWAKMILLNMFTIDYNCLHMINQGKVEVVVQLNIFRFDFQAFN